MIGRGVFIGLPATMRDRLRQCERHPSRAGIHAREIEAFEDAERGRQPMAMTLPPNGADLPAAIGAAHHLASQRLIRCEIVARQRAAHAAEVCDQWLAALPIHHAVRPVTRHVVQQHRKRRLHTMRAGRPRLPFVQEVSLRRRVASQQMRRGVPRGRQARRHRVSLSGKRDGRCDHPRGTKPAEALDCRNESARIARNRYHACTRRSRWIAAVLPDCGQRSAAIERLGTTIGPRDQHVAASGQAGVRRIDHGERKGRRHRRIDRIAALPQNVGPGLRRNSRSGRDDASHWRKLHGRCYTRQRMPRGDLFPEIGPVRDRLSAALRPAT